MISAEYINSFLQRVGMAKSTLRKKLLIKPNKVDQYLSDGISDQGKCRDFAMLVKNYDEYTADQIIKDLRSEYGLSVEQFALITGFDSQVIYNAESGKAVKMYFYNYMKLLSNEDNFKSLLDEYENLH